MSILLLPYELFFIICWPLNLPTLLALRMTCSVLRERVNNYMPKRFADLISPFTSKPCKLATIMCDTNSYIVGPRTLSYIFPSVKISESNKTLSLTIACCSGVVPSLLSFFASDGYATGEYSALNDIDLPIEYASLIRAVFGYL